MASRQDAREASATGLADRRGSREGAGPRAPKLEKPFCLILFWQLLVCLLCFALKKIFFFFTYVSVSVCMSMCVRGPTEGGKVVRSPGARVIGGGAQVLRPKTGSLLTTQLSLAPYFMLEAKSHGVAQDGAGLTM